MLGTQEKRNGARNGKRTRLQDEMLLPPTLDAKIFLDNQEHGTLALEGQKARRAYGVQKGKVSPEYANALLQLAREKQRDNFSWLEVGIVLNTNGVQGRI